MHTSLNQIQSALIEEDLEGLIQAGAPRDEYESEAMQIFQALSNLPETEKNRDILVSIISLVWVQNFEIDTKGVSLRLQGIERIAKKLLSA